MRIRTQLVLAFLLLAVVPLAGIVLYSYHSSQRAVEIASQQQAAAVTEQMDERMATITSDLRHSIENVSSLPVETFAVLGAVDSAEEAPKAAEQLLKQVGPAVALVDEVEFVPTPVAPPYPSAIATGPDLGTTLPRIVIDVEKIVADAHREIGNKEEYRRDMAELRKWAEEQKKEAAQHGGRRFVYVAPPPVEATPKVAAVPATDPVPAVVAPPPPPPPDGEEVAVGEGVVAGAAGATGVAAGAPEIRGRMIAEQRGKRQVELARERAAIHARVAAQIEQRDQEIQKRLEAKQKERVRKEKTQPKKKVTTIGPKLEVPVIRGGEEVGRVRASVRSQALVAEVLSRANRAKGEIPFAVDAAGKLYTASEKDRAALQRIGVTQANAPRGNSRQARNNWVVATSLTPDTSLTFGVARPIHDSLQEVRRAAGRNFLYGLGLIGLALVGIVPLASHISRDVKLITAGAERIASGDLDTEVPVRSGNEFGQLAGAFNRMARELKEHQEKLVEEERLRKENEIEQRLLKSDYERKSAELEQARAFQLSLLPKTIPATRHLDVAVSMKTATEVGGDYYDFKLDRAGDLVVAIGDATGHGATAGTMVTIVKSLFSAYDPSEPLNEFLAEAANTIKRMALGRMAMALSAARISSSAMRIAVAGMPPLLILRASGAFEEIVTEAMPLGTLAFEYEELEIALRSGDTVLFMSDGFPELMNEGGEPLGYRRAQEIFRSSGSGTADEIVARLVAACDEWTGGGSPNDDITFVVVKVA